MSDVEISSISGSYPSPTRQVARLEEVVLYQQPDVTDLFIRSLTTEVNGFSSRDIPAVEEDEMRALFFYAILAKLVFVTNTRRNEVRVTGNRVLDVRRLDDRWVLPAAMIPVLGAIGNIEGSHPVEYRPVLTKEIIQEAAKANEDVDGTRRLERVEATLLQLARNGLLVNSRIPRTREGNPDVMTSLLWERELYFHREGVDGIIAAIAGTLAAEPQSWSDATDDHRSFVMSTFVGRDAFKSVYLPQNVELCVREFVRTHTREK